MNSPQLDTFLLIKKITPYRGIKQIGFLKIYRHQKNSIHVITTMSCLGSQSYLTSIWDNVGELSAACVSPEQTGATGDGQERQTPGHCHQWPLHYTAHPGRGRELRPDNHHLIGPKWSQLSIAVVIKQQLNAECVTFPLFSPDNLVTTHHPLWPGWC